MDELRQPSRAAIQKSSGASTQSDTSRFERLKRQHRSPNRVAKLVREVSQTLRALKGDRLLASPHVLGDCLGNGVVETMVENVKLGRGNRCLRLVRQLGDRQAKTAIVVNDLGNREAQREETTTVLGRAIRHRS